jgi:hypothetical protein
VHKKFIFPSDKSLKRHSKKENIPSNPIPSQPVKRFSDEPPLSPYKSLFNKNKNR